MKITGWASLDNNSIALPRWASSSMVVTDLANGLSRDALVAWHVANVIKQGAQLFLLQRVAIDFQDEMPPCKT
ncbi:hypothetical protein CYK37_29650 [Mesorhizobium loti]|nr:hypothetical protein [Mesorhizobium loti]PLP55605.1 hypothetical protein CYK37_29650 [Mesorhizobium loti]